jgi:3-deoxy-7-phosphoheptulonate synthase
MVAQRSSTTPENSRPYRLVNNPTRTDRTIVRIGDAEIGNGQITLIAGPCSVETTEQLTTTAKAVKAAGAKILRGGAFKPRTSPYDFQGLGVEGLELLAEARRITGLPFVTEVVDSEDVDLVASYADALQIGARNMSAFRLLQKAAATGKPIILKRGFQSTIREWLLSAEYILAQGNDQVVLCERGIRTFDSEFTRNTLDLAAVPVVQQESHLPVIVDPSHGSGRSDLVAPMAMGALAVGADGLMVEVHSSPETALCDGKQSLAPDEFHKMVNDIRKLAIFQGRSV